MTDAEIEALLASTHDLALLRGKWVEVDQQRLRETLGKFQKIERLTETKLCTIEFDVKPEGLIWLVDHHDVRDCKVTGKKVTNSSKAPCP